MFVWPEPPGCSGHCVPLLAQTRHSRFHSLASKGLRRPWAVSSHCLAMSRPGRWGGIFFFSRRRVSGTVPAVPHGDSWQQLQQSGRCHVRLQRFSRHVSAAQFTDLYWRFASAQSSGGQLMSGPWPSGPNYGFQSRPLRARFRTWLRLPDNCV